MMEEVNQLLSRSPKSALSQLLVVEIGGYVSAPVATQTLLSEGATVIKIEPKNAGDPSRKALPPAMFTSLNASKISVALDINEPLYAEILSLADVIIDNRSPSAKERDRILQEFFNTPNKKHPSIYCSIVGYDSRENKDRLAFDVSVQAETGMAWSNAFSPEMPLKVGFYVLDVTAGMQAASSVKTAIISIQRGCKIPESDHNVIKIEISMAKVAALFQTGQYLRYLTTGEEIIRNGNRDLFLSPFSFYKAKDGVLLSIGVVSDGQYARFCNEVLHHKELADQYPTNEIRVKNSEVLDSELSAIIATKTSEEWLVVCKQHNIACTRVNKVSEALEQPFAKDLIRYTTNNVPIVPVVPSITFFQDPLWDDAPRLNQHRALIEKLIEYYQTTKSTSFSELCTIVKRTQELQAPAAMTDLHDLQDKEEEMTSEIADMTSLKLT